MKKQLKKQTQLWIEAAVLLAMILMALFPVEGDSYRRYATDTLHYQPATVLEVQSETLEESGLGTGQILGVQQLLVELSNGEQVELTNYLTETHNVMAKEGQRLIVCADVPENAEPYYTVYNYHRMPALIALVGLFLLLMLLIGGRKGFDASLALIFTLEMILTVTVPLMFNGVSPVAVGFVTVICATVVSLILLHGLTADCALAIGVTLLGECAACILFAVFSSLLHLTGFQTDSAEGLLLIAQNTGLQVKTLLLAGTMLSSLGAVMDVAVSLLSALREVALASKKPTAKGLFQSGMNIGRDMIGTMSNTLIFAFAGSALLTMLVFYSYGIQFYQLISSDFLAVELAQGLCSTAAVVLTVPAGAAIGAAAYSRAATKESVHPAKGTSR